jgi:hypothetical protein
MPVEFVQRREYADVILKFPDARLRGSVSGHPAEASKPVHCEICPPPSDLALLWRITVDDADAFDRDDRLLVDVYRGAPRSYRFA